MKIVFFGGLQARELCDLYKSLMGASVKAAWIDASGWLRPDQAALLEGADVVASQARGDGAVDDFERLQIRGDRIVFPAVAFDALWPFGGQPHVGNTPAPGFPDGPFPIELGDAWLNRRLAAGGRPETIEAEYLALDVAAVVDLDAYRTMALARQSEIDQICGSDFAARIEASFRLEPPFANPVSPGPSVLRELVNHVLAKLGSRMSLTKDWRPPERDIPELPVHPSVAAHFGLNWTKGRLYRTAAGDRVEFEEYVRRYLAYAEGAELEAGIKLVAKGRIAEGRRRLELATQQPMGQRSLSARRALAAPAHPAPAAPKEADQPDLAKAIALFGQHRWVEAEAATLAQLGRTPTSTDAFVFLSMIREKRGDAEGRVAALRSALQIKPRDAFLQSRLTVALAAKGDIAGAIRSAEAEIEQQPDNPHAHAFLSQLLERIGDRERARAELGAALAAIADGPAYAELRAALNQRRTDLDKPASN